MQTTAVRTPPPTDDDTTIRRIPMSKILLCSRVDQDFMLLSVVRQIVAGKSKGARKIKTCKPVTTTRPRSRSPGGKGQPFDDGGPICARPATAVAGTAVCTRPLYFPLPHDHHHHWHATHVHAKMQRYGGFCYGVRCENRNDLRACGRFSTIHHRRSTERAELPVSCCPIDGRTACDGSV